GQVLLFEINNSFLLQDRVANLKRVCAALARADTEPAVPLGVLLCSLRVDLIMRSDYYGTWIARMKNVKNKADTVLLADRPLPKESRFQTEKAEAQRKKLPLPAEP